MPIEMPVEIVPSEMAQIVGSVFQTMLGLETAADGPPWFPGSDRLTSAVHFAGDFNGAVLFECSRAQSCRLAGRFLSIDPPDAVDDVVRDVLAELANMIGGNMKCVLARGTSLSMPSVVDGSDYSMRVCGAMIQERIAFQSAEGDFWVTVLTTKSARS
jgi:chemotaxis protein CheX